MPTPLPAAVVERSTIGCWVRVPSDGMCIGPLVWFSWAQLDAVHRGLVDWFAGVDTETESVDDGSGVDS